MENSNRNDNVLFDFMLELYKIGLALKYEKKPPDDNKGKKEVV